MLMLGICLHKNSDRDLLGISTSFTSQFVTPHLFNPLLPWLSPLHSGFFSVDVLRLALARFGAIELIPSQKFSISQPSSRGGGEGEREALGARKAAEAAGDLTQELGFLVNRAEHWFALRRVGRRWWNLNSTLERGPEEVGRFYLSAFLEALVAEGYSVFLVRGEGLPERGYPEEVGGHGRRDIGTWYRVSDLVAGGQRRGGGGEGGGRGKRGLWGRLTGRGRHVAGEGTTGMGAGGKGGEEGGQPGPTGTEGGSEEEELARAIAMSLEER